MKTITIEFYIRRNYGTDHIYLADPALAKYVTALTRRETLFATARPAIDGIMAMAGVRTEWKEIPAPRQ